MRRQGEQFMGEGPHRVLIADIDPDTLITLQHILEDAGVDTTVTWDEAEARRLLRTTSFDLLLLGDHPPEFRPEAVLREFSSPSTVYPCFILRATNLEKNIDRMGRPVIGVMPKRDPLAILEQVKKHLALRDCPGHTRHNWVSVAGDLSKVPSKEAA